MSIDLDDYRQRSETFLEEIDREYYLHLSGQKPDLEIDSIYERHAGLFSTDAVAFLRQAVADAPDGDDGRRSRYLLAFAFDGHLGQATKLQAEEVARLEATLDVPVDGEAIPYRQTHVELANAADGGRREAIEQARNAVLCERINPLHLDTFERTRQICHEHGWPSYAAAQAELRGIDLDRLAGQVADFVEATDRVYPDLLGPRLEAAGLPALGRAGRADVARLMRAPELDELFPESELVASFERTLTGLGFDLAAQDNVHLDTERRPTKSPRAFCSPVKVPAEVYLVFAPIGGREDYSALYHEGGHTEHYANVDPDLAFEFRHLGDNSVTESFAFLLEHLTESPAWMASVLGAGDSGATVPQVRAIKLYFLRRYAAKIQYELELLAPAPDLEAMPARYAELMESSTRLRWPSEPWLDDVDGGFYVACYLRAWALEAHWRRALTDRFGERWFEVPAAGAWLRDLWAQGQRLDADELLAEVLGEELDFGLLAEEFGAAAT